LLGEFPRKSPVNTHEPIPNELLYLRVADRARAQTIIVSHEISLYRQPFTDNSEGGDGRVASVHGQKQLGGCGAATSPTRRQRFRQRFCVLPAEDPTPERDFE
jgi:hypothetical protein